ncbi:MAG TPA: antibiotic biosynthesis monooxygenase [Gemmatimonadaceae bacterium]|nr:antibiotic biosynthesis monooxygenase [Gemmatimonadaceae bacterium]
MPIHIHLHCRVAPERRDDLLRFLARAFPTYEAPGGIRMRLYERRDDPGTLIEVVEYESVEAYERDQRRVVEDPAMRALLAEWRALLAEPPRVETWEEVGVG